MNERIKELAFEANKDLDGNVPIGFAEKFAELIVRECMDLALAEQMRYANFTHRNMAECAVTVSNFRLLMKDHFGVK